MKKKTSIDVTGTVRLLTVILVSDENLKDLCLQGEERFGAVRSRLYALTAPWRRSFVEFVADDVLSRNPRSVLDIGCGTCDILVQMRSNEIELYGIDPSPHMLELAEKKLRGSIHAATELSKVHLSPGSCRLIPFDRKFDTIFSSTSFHHWKNREESITHILARLNENGEFAIYEYNREALPFLQKLILGRHTLSADEVRELSFDGYEKTIEKSGLYLAVKFKKSSLE